MYFNIIPHVYIQGQCNKSSVYDVTVDERIRDVEDSNGRVMFTDTAYILYTSDIEKIDPNSAELRSFQNNCTNCGWVESLVG